MPNPTPVAVNKVEYGLSNVHYAKCTFNSDTQKYTYETPVRIPGGVSVSFDPSGDNNPFYADDGVFFDVKTNAGYEGDLEIATIPESFLTDILGEQKVDGMLVENSDTQGAEFALMFEFKGDKKAKRHIFYRCSAQRPSIKSKTKEKTTTPNTNTLKLTCMTRENDHNVKASLLESENEERYAAWYEEVQEPVAAASGGGG